MNCTQVTWHHLAQLSLASIFMVRSSAALWIASIHKLALEIVILTAKTVLWQGFRGDALQMQITSLDSRKFTKALWTALWQPPFALAKRTLLFIFCGTLSASIISDRCDNYSYQLGPGSDGTSSTRGEGKLCFTEQPAKEMCVTQTNANIQSQHMTFQWLRTKGLAITGLLVTHIFFKM